MARENLSSKVLEHSVSLTHQRKGLSEISLVAREHVRLWNGVKPKSTTNKVYMHRVEH